jgi:hypothetical protein
MDPITAIVGTVGTIVSRIWPDKSEADRAQLTLALQEQLSQSEINKIEASNERLFVSGWRPYIGWVCGIAFSWQFVLQPIVIFILAAFNIHLVLPAFDTGTFMPVLLGMLGLSSMRSFEKVKSKGR